MPAHWLPLMRPPITFSSTLTHGPLVYYHSMPWLPQSLLSSSLSIGWCITYHHFNGVSGLDGWTVADIDAQFPWTTAMLTVSKAAIGKPISGFQGWYPFYLLTEHWGTVHKAHPTSSSVHSFQMIQSSISSLASSTCFSYMWLYS